MDYKIVGGLAALALAAVLVLARSNVARVRIVASVIAKVYCVLLISGIATLFIVDYFDVGLNGTVVITGDCKMFREPFERHPGNKVITVLKAGERYKARRLRYGKDELDIRIRDKEGRVGWVRIGENSDLIANDADSKSGKRGCGC